MRVSRPCTEDWDKMTGNDRVRFCSHCAKDVNNISEMTPKQAVRLARASGGNICIRYKFDPVTNAPIFADRFHQISRRAPALASGAMAASLSLSTLAFSQESAPSIDPVPAVSIPAEAPQINDSENEKEEKAPTTGMGSVYGTVVDANGAVIADAKVRLLDEEGTETRSITTDNDGNYQLDALEARKYRIEISVTGFHTFQQDVTVPSGGRRKLNATMDVASMGGVMVSIQEYETPLAAAVSQEDLDAVKDLIAKGENVNKREEDKTTPLFVAVENGNMKIVETLLNFGAKLNARNKAKQTPLMQVDEDASAELINLLIRFGAKVNLVDNDGNTALMRAARSASSDVVKALIDAGADVNLINKDGRSALMQAADNGNLESVRALLLAGAMVNLRDKQGESAWDLTGNDDIENLLVSFGAESGSADETGTIETTTTTTQEPEPVPESTTPQDAPVD